MRLEMLLGLLVLWVLHLLACAAGVQPFPVLINNPAGSAFIYFSNHVKRL